MMVPRSTWPTITWLKATRKRQWNNTIDCDKRIPLSRISFFRLLIRARSQNNSKNNQEFLWLILMKRELCTGRCNRTLARDAGIAKRSRAVPGATAELIPRPRGSARKVTTFIEFNRVYAGKMDQRD